jgi:hypothetical protein
MAVFFYEKSPAVDKVAAAIVRTSELKAASEQVSASGRRDCLKVLSALVAAVRPPAAASAL